jgi:putative acyl-CoA dehydrogenase
VKLSFTAHGTQLIDEVGRGIATITEMVQQTRLDCILPSAALLPRALVEALHHALIVMHLAARCLSNR